MSSSRSHKHKHLQMRWADDCQDVLGRSEQPWRENMKCWSIFGAAILTTSFFARQSKAQIYWVEAASRAAAFEPKAKAPESKAESLAPIAIKKSADAKTLSAVRFHKTQFLILGAAVYGASLADMHQTLQERKYSWWYETDPVARPLVTLPTPAYYVTGLAMATSLNWISWRMGHSRKWHRLAAIPQVLAITGNIYGYRSNLFSEMKANAAVGQTNHSVVMLGSR